MTFEELAAGLDVPMTIVTTAVRNARAGCLVGFHSQCGIEPARYAIWLSKANHTFRIGALADVFAVHFLRREDHALAKLFGCETGDHLDKFAQCAWTSGPDGVPLIDDCPYRFVARRVSLVDSGADHICIVLDPAAGVGDALPVGLPADVMWLMSRHVHDLAAGHAATERQQPL